MLNGAGSLENYVAVSQKIQHKQLYDPGILFLFIQPMRLLWALIFTLETKWGLNKLKRSVQSSNFV